MTTSDMVTQVKERTGEANTDVVQSFLDHAILAIFNKAYPFATDEEEVVIPERYHSLAVDIAVYLYLKQGAEGETSHNESGVNRSYESAYIPNSMLSAIIPRGKVPKE